MSVHGGGEPYIDPHIQAEEAFMAADFTAMVARISLHDPDIAVPSPWAKHPEPLDSYRLAPVVATHWRRHRTHRSTDPAGFFNDVPENVLVEYWEQEGPNELKIYETPPLDAHQGILLVRDGLVANSDAGLAVAIISGGINPYVQGGQPAEMIIQQCQGLVLDKHQPEYSRALRAGFLWRDTLFNVWERIAGMVPAVGTIAVRAAHAMSYSKSGRPASLDQLRRGYDDVAARRGFDPNVRPGMWVKQIVRD